jgi:hypothetical protein
VGGLGGGRGGAGGVGGTGGGPTYRLADYLEQHARRTRRLRCPTASFWHAAHEHAHTTHDTLNLARAAHDRLRLRHAERLYTEAADAGDPIAPVWLARMREAAGDHEAAERLAHQAADQLDVVQVVGAGTAVLEVRLTYASCGPAATMRSNSRSDAPA